MFSDEFLLTQAVLDGRKTQTRRICKEQIWAHSDIVNAENGIFHFEIPKYKVGEIVAIAQSYHTIYDEFGLETMDMLVSKLKYSNAWTNKMFVKSELMPHQIRITKVRIQRLQDISDEDCLAEGIRKETRYSFIENVKQLNGDSLVFSCNFDSPREAYAELIDKVSGKGTWKNNPYVFVYDFELIK